MLEISLPIIVGFISLIIGTYTDFKTREVPDWVNYGLIITGFAINSIHSIVFSTWSYLIYSLLGFGACFLISLLMFYTGQWGGGDSKMLMALGALIGLRLNFRNEFLIDFLINVIIIGGVFGLIWSLVLGLRNSSKVIDYWKRFLAKKDAVKIKSMLFVMAFILLVLSALIRDKLFFAYALLASIFSILTFFLWVFIKSIENVAMIKFVVPARLTEGDWIAKDIYYKGKYITGPKDLGVSKRQIKELTKLYKIGKIKKVLIKEGIPFVPSFLVAYLITFFVGNILMILI